MIWAFFSLVICGNAQQKMSFYDFKVTDIDGKSFDLSTLKGKKVLVVNTASKCGHTPTVCPTGRTLQKNTAAKNFVIIGFPAKQFPFSGTGDQCRDQKFLYNQLWRYLPNDGQDICQGQGYSSIV